MRTGSRLLFTVAAAAVFAAIGYRVSLAYPIPQYLSQSTLRIIPQRVPEEYVLSTVRSAVTERLPIITQQVMTRTRLERIVQDLGLYADERMAGELMEDIIRRMREEHIRISAAGDQTFTVSYVNEDPRLAMRVTEKLAAYMVDENLRDREIQAENANQFLSAQVDDVRRELNARSSELNELKRRREEVSASMALEVEVLEARFRALLMRSAEAQTAANLERRQIGEQFKIIDAASFPERPISLPRSLFLLTGGTCGALLAVAVQWPRISSARSRSADRSVTMPGAGV